MKKRYAEGGAVREGRNENIDDDTRTRAMRFVENGGKSDDAPKATNKSKVAVVKSSPSVVRDSLRKIESVETKKEEDYSKGVPRPMGQANSGSGKSKSEAFMDDAKDNAGKAIAGMGIAGGAYAAAKAVRNMRNMLKTKDAAEAAEKAAGAKRAADAAAKASRPAPKKVSEDVLDILKGKNDKPKTTKSDAVKKAKQKEEDDSMRFADEGNPNYRKGGTVRGWGSARGTRAAKIR